MKNIYHEGKLINKAGVDRVVLSHVELKKINWPVFKKAITASSDIIYDAFRSANRTYYVTEGGDRLHYMTITDPEVGHLNFGANVNCRKRINEGRAFAGKIPQRLLLYLKEVLMCQEGQRVLVVFLAVQI